MNEEVLGRHKTLVCFVAVRWRFRGGNRVLNELPDNERAGRLAHMVIVMSLCRHYQWPTVRGMYANILEDIQYGTIQWSDTITPYKEAALNPSMLLATKVPSQYPKNKVVGTNSQICRNYNWSFCSRKPCQYQHKLSYCLKYKGETVEHAGKECRHRQEYQREHSNADNQ